MMERIEIIYLMDPQCGWCFGFSDRIQEMVAHYQDDVRVIFTLVTGGLFHPALATGHAFAEDKRPIAARVMQHFGVEFAQSYFTNVLASGKLDSLPPCQVINAVKIIAPEQTFTFAAHLVKAAFREGRNISEMNICLEVAQDYGFKREELQATLATSSLAAMTEESFDFAKNVATGFPSLFLKTQRDMKYLGGVQLSLDALETEIKNNYKI